MPYNKSLPNWQGLLQSRPPSKVSQRKYSLGKYQDHPIGYRPVRVDWKDLDKCNVCHMDEVNNASFLIESFVCLSNLVCFNKLVLT